MRSIIYEGITFLYNSTMTQLFIFGASITYGVGAEESGWADLIKRKLHDKMYRKHGIGEKYEVYNFAKPEATIEFVLKTFDEQKEHYQKSGKKIVILSVGMNNSKAEGSPENYISDVTEYKQKVEELLKKVIMQVDHVLFVGFTPVDESKTTPMREGGSYFWNDRIQEFNNACKETCEEQGVTFVDIPTDPEVWKKEYLYEDGLHPNQQGHQLMFKEVSLHLKKLL